MLCEVQLEGFDRGVVVRGAKEGPASVVRVRASDRVALGFVGSEFGAREGAEDGGQVAGEEGFAGGHGGADLMGFMVLISI